MIGSVTFDGASEAPLWTEHRARHRAASSRTWGSRPQHALELTFLLGLIAAIVLVYGFYRLGVAGARSVGGGFSDRRGSRAPSCTRSCRSRSPTWPRTTSRCCSSRARRSASWPPTRSATARDLFGTADSQIDYGADRRQRHLVLAGGLRRRRPRGGAHPRPRPRAGALRRAKLAVRSQYWMLAVMVGFTSLALWLLSQANV